MLLEKLLLIPCQILCSLFLFFLTFNLDDKLYWQWRTIFIPIYVLFAYIPIVIEIMERLNVSFNFMPSVFERQDDEDRHDLCILFNTACVFLLIPCVVTLALYVAHMDGLIDYVFSVVFCASLIAFSFVVGFVGFIYALLFTGELD